MDVAHVDGPYTLQCAEHLLEGCTVLVYTVGNEQRGILPAIYLAARNRGAVSYFSLVDDMFHGGLTVLICSSAIPE